MAAAMSIYVSMAMVLLWDTSPHTSSRHDKKMLGGHIDLQKSGAWMWKCMQTCATSYVKWIWPIIDAWWIKSIDKHNDFF